jgi:hypothetical protein
MGLMPLPTLAAGWMEENIIPGRYFSSTALRTGKSYTLPGRGFNGTVFDRMIGRRSISSTKSMTCPNSAGAGSVPPLRPAVPKTRR